MKEQLDEVRLYVLPNEQLSDADFERKLKKQLAKAQPEQRAALERSARASRKLGAMTQKDFARYWLDRFAAETVDATWARAVEALCMPGLSKAESAKLESFECRRERCKVVMTSSDGAAPAGVILEACGLGGMPRPSQPKLGWMLVEQTVDGSGTTRTTSMLVREGASMVPE